MEAPGKFSHLRERDVSVPMLRVKMSRRRSQSQKENRERAVNSRRQLDQVPELDSTLEASIMAVNISNVKETAPPVGQSAKDLAGAQRLEMLKRWKETRSLIKEKEKREKEKREKERKGVFKVGLYRPTDSVSLQLPVAKPCEAAVKVPQTRSTRLTKLDQQPNKPVVGRMTRSRTALVQPQRAQAATSVKVVQPAVQYARAKVQPAAIRGNAVPRAGPVACAATISNVDRPAGGRTTRGNAKPVATSTGRGKNKVVVKTVSAVVDETAAVGAESTLCEEEAELVAESDTLAPRPATEGTSSFAPKGFVFETPAGLSTFKFEPLTPRSVDTFLRPSSILNFPPFPPLEPETSGPSPPKSPLRSPQAPTSPQEPQHDVPYFKSQVITETARLNSLSQLWEVKVDDDSIPEERSLSTAKLTRASSPCGRVTRQSIAMSNHSSPDHRSRTPARHALTLAHTPCTQSEQSPFTEAASSLDSASSPMRAGEEKPEIGSQPLSPRLSPAPSSQSPEPDLSFTVSPCPVVPSTPTVVPAHENYTPDSSVVEDGPGLDMARYLQPSDRCSLSARNFDAMETSLPVDVEMESPIALCGDERTQEDATMPPTDLDQVLPPQAAFEAQNAESDLILFTPNLKDRIRQSVCPSDLMAFTPPN